MPRKAASGPTASSRSSAAAGRASVWLAEDAASAPQGRPQGPDRPRPRRRGAPRPLQARGGAGLQARAPRHLRRPRRGHRGRRALHRHALRRGRDPRPIAWRACAASAGRPSPARFMRSKARTRRRSGPSQLLLQPATTASIDRAELDRLDRRLREDRRWRCTPPTRSASSTATSSPATSWSRPRTSRSSSTSASPSWTAGTGATLRSPTPGLFWNATARP